MTVFMKPVSRIPPPPVVSVIVPAYNAGRWIRSTLDSIRAQTLREIEIIVVDDGSQDDTSEQVSEVAKSDSRVRVIQQANAGVGAARNTGIRHANADLVATVDADDLWREDKLEKQVKRLSECDAQTGMIYCWSRHIDEYGNDLGFHIPIAVEGDVREAIILRNFVENGSVPLFRKQVLEEIGPYLTRQDQGGAEGCEDWDFYIRIAETWRFGLVREEMAGYRQCDSCMSNSTRGMSDSFRVIMNHARRRNPDIPEKIFRWSEGHFQSYVLLKSYQSCDHAACIHAGWRSVCSDPVMLINRRMLILVAKSLVWLALGKDRRNFAARDRRASAIRLPDKKVMRQKTLLDRIQSKRLTRIAGDSLL